jgi:hypothetical protein
MSYRKEPEKRPLNAKKVAGKGQEAKVRPKQTTKNVRNQN